MKYLFPLLIAALCTITAFAGKPFPEMKGHTLNNKELTLPKDTKGKFTVVGVASSMRAQQDLQTWFQPMYSSFIGNPMYKVNMYIIPMIKGFILAGKEKIESQIKSNTDTSLYQYVFVFQGEVNPIKTALEMEDKDKPYFFVISPRGEIVYRTSGKYSEKKLEEIADQLSE